MKLKASADEALKDLSTTEDQLGQCRSELDENRAQVSSCICVIQPARCDEEVRSVELGPALWPILTLYTLTCHAQLPLPSALLNLLCGR